jgi:hypothetical protein
MSTKHQVIAVPHQTVEGRYICTLDGKIWSFPRRRESYPDGAFKDAPDPVFFEHRAKMGMVESWIGAHVVDEELAIPILFTRAQISEYFLDEVNINFFEVTFSGDSF